jgi:UDP-N-acetylglucosamine 4,6-dehydratase
MSDAIVNPEVEFLLGRPLRARVGAEELAAFAGRRALVTGAAGSIGSELARSLAAAAPAELALLDHSELGLFTIERELRGRFAAQPFEVALADVTHRHGMRRVCLETRPDVVFHAAAYKHVTMAERAPAAAVAVNVLGAAYAALAAEAVGARFVLISSDKAADPQSVMGASKRLAERITLAMASPRFRPIVVRFGNVLGSSGSVVQIMRECIRAGRPVPLTDPDATRYFMSVEEAVALVLRADITAHAAEIFWLEMGQPIRMRDLTERVMTLEATAGFAPVPIEIVGLRPGEKKTETLTDPRLMFERTVDRRIHVAREPALPRREADALLDRLRRAVARADDQLALDVLSASVQGFVPSEQAAERGRRAVAIGAAGLQTRRQGQAA